MNLEMRLSMRWKMTWSTVFKISVSQPDSERKIWSRNMLCPSIHFFILFDDDKKPLAGHALVGNLLTFWGIFKDEHAAISRSKDSSAAANIGSCFNMFTVAPMIASMII